MQRHYSLSDIERLREIARHTYEPVDTPGRFTAWRDEALRIRVEYANDRAIELRVQTLIAANINPDEAERELDNAARDRWIAGRLAQFRGSACSEIERMKDWLKMRGLFDAVDLEAHHLYRERTQAAGSASHA